MPIAIVEPVPVPTPPPALAPLMPDRFQAVLASSIRGNVQTRRVSTQSAAFAQARRLLDEAQGREWHKGEVVSVRIEAVVD